MFFWEALLSQEILKSEHVGNRAVLALEQSLDAISVVQNHAALTDRGENLLEFNRVEAQRSLDKLARLPAFNAWQSASRKRQARESANWKQTHGGENVIA